MRKRIGFDEFQKEFKAWRPHNFSYEGLKILFDYLEEREEENGEELELDIIALCSSFDEFDSIEQFNFEYDKNYSNYSEIEEAIVLPIDERRFIVEDY